MHWIAATGLLMTLLPGQAFGQGGIEVQRWGASAVVGPSHFVGDFGEADLASVGLSARGALEASGFGVGLTFSRWPEVGSFRLLNTQLEMEVQLGSSQFLAPALLAAMGYTRGKYLGTREATVPDGPSAAFGIGLKVRPRAPFGFRVDGLVRTDDGGWNGELRLLAGFMPGRSTSLPNSDVEFETFWLVSFAGPWEFVDPGIGMAISRPLLRDVHGALGLALIHWRIPSENHRGYEWDTRSIMATPGIEWRAGIGPVSLRVGPAIVAMGEGPGNGVSLGAIARANWRPPLGDLPVQFGIGALWLALDREDQIGFTFHGGIVL